MKKLVLAISVIGLVTLTSCGAQENCRGDRGYTVAPKIEKQNTVITVNAVESDTRQ
jgi:hypothetical protein